MANSSITRIKGVSSFPNYLNDEGDSLTIGSNVVIDRDNILEPRRGIKVLSELTDYSKQLLNYKDRVLAHYGNSLGYFDLNDPGNLTTFKGTNLFIQSSPSTILTIVDHGFAVGDAIFFTRQRNYAVPNAYFPLPAPLDEVTQYVVRSIINKDQFEIAVSIVAAAISVASGQGILVNDYAVNEVEEKLRIKSIELNSNLYFTTINGVKKVSKLDAYAIGNAGGVSALNVDLALDFSGSGGFFGPQNPSPLDVEVAYRIVWGTKDANNNLILGRVSERAVIQNFTRQNADVILSIPVPQGIGTNYFYQIYRTNIFGVDGSGDEMRLVLEATYDGFSTLITTTDSVPENIRDTGTPLYTNELSGEGILQNNQRPPVCQDITVFKNRAWYANTRTSQKLDLTFLGFDAFQDGLLPSNVVSATGSNPATITFSAAHNIVNGEYLALANTTSQDGQYIATVISPTVVQIQANSAGFGTDYAIYKTYITVTKGTQVNRYFFVGRPETYLLTAKPTASVNTSDYFNLTSIDDKIKYYFWFDKTVGGTGTDPLVPNRVGFKVDLFTAPVPVTDDEVAVRIKEAIDATGDFFVTTTVNPGELSISTITSGPVTDVASGTQSGSSLVSIAMTQNGFGEDASKGFVRLSAYASPAASIEDTAKSLVRVINFTPSSPVYAYYLATTDSLPGQFFLEEKNYSSVNFTVQGSGLTSDVSFSPSITTATSSTNNIGNNVLMFSKEQQPEAVPIVNSFKIGPQDKAIKRILALRNSLFILKEEGIYRLTGENESTFNIALDDNSATILAPDSAVVLNNQIYCLTTQGVSTVSETGVGVISRDIEDSFNRVASENFTNFSTATFGVSYEADRAYLLFTVNNEEDVTAKIAYRYNSFTQSWTTFDKSAICGIVSPKNKLHLGADDIMAVEVERKKINSRDYVDRQYNRSTSAYQSKRMYVDNAGEMKVGDSLTQEQYLSIDEYNNLVGRLKLDPLLNFSQTFPKMITTGGADFNNSLRDLVTELNLKDTTRITKTFDLNSDVNLATDVITISNHGFNNNDIVKFTTAGTPPIGLVANASYQVVNATTNTFQLTTLIPNVLVQGGAIGLGVFTLGPTTYTFNMVRDIDYANSEIEFIGHNLVDGNIVTFSTSGTPPTGLINGRTYKIINATSNNFQVKEVTIDLQAPAGSGTGSLEQVYYYSGETNNKKQQREFNQIISSLNISTGVFFANYEASSGMEELDLIISSVNFSQNYVTLQFDGPFYVGDIIHYKSIVSEIMWDYCKLGDASSLKHVSYGTVMVENNSLNKMTVGYTTDLSGDTESTEFTLDGNGAYGKAKFGSTAFGGNGTSYPLRVVIPRQKQRCRHIRTYVKHSSAFIKFNILGVSYEYEVTSTRAYRK